MLDCIKKLKFWHYCFILFVIAGVHCFIAIFMCLFGDWSLMGVGL